VVVVVHSLIRVKWGRRRRARIVQSDTVGPFHVDEVFHLRATAETTGGKRLSIFSSFLLLSTTRRRTRRIWGANVAFPSPLHRGSPRKRQGIREYF